jgi:hypothetical protein
MALLSNIAVGFWFDWSNHFFGSLWLVSWLSPEELRRGRPVTMLESAAGEDPGLALREASRWFLNVTECAGEVRRGRG